MVKIFRTGERCAKIEKRFGVLLYVVFMHLQHSLFLKKLMCKEIIPTSVFILSGARNKIATVVGLSLDTDWDWKDFNMTLSLCTVCNVCDDF